VSTPRETQTLRERERERESVRRKVKTRWNYKDVIEKL